MVLMRRKRLVKRRRLNKLSIAISYLRYKSASVKRGKRDFIHNEVRAQLVHSIRGREIMPQLVAFGRQVLRVVLVGRREDRNLIDNLQVKASQIEGFRFFGVVRQ